MKKEKIDSFEELTRDDLVKTNGGLIVVWFLSSLAFAMIWDITGDVDGAKKALSDGSAAAQR
jgi:hypothetical protein